MTGTGERAGVPLTPAEVTLEISSLHLSGSGVGHHPDFGHVYVPFAFPGERIAVRIESEARTGQWNARRLNPPTGHCAIAGQCGGCAWPGASYEKQIEWKKNLLLRAASGVPEITALPVAVHGASATLGFRNRVHLHANFFNGNLEFGFYGRASRKLIPVDDCPVAEEPIRQFIRSLSAAKYGGWPASENFGFGIEVIHLSEEDSKLLVILYTSPERRETLRTAMPRFTALPQAPLVREAFAETDEVFVWQQLQGVVMHTKPGAFQQGNRAQSDVIRGLIAAAVAAQKPEVLFDLYGGSGNYALPLHSRVGQIYGCDDNRIGIEVAQINIAGNAIQNAAYICGDTAEILAVRQNHGWPDCADFVVADPARFGMTEAAIAGLRLLKPRTLFYISNNRVPFIRDAKRLLAAGFTPVKMHLVDFFPHTPHLNIVTLWHFG